MTNDIRWHKKTSRLPADTKALLDERYDDVVREIKTGESLRVICKRDGLNYQTFYKQVKCYNPEVLSMKKGERSRSRISESRIAKYRGHINVDELIDLYSNKKKSSYELAAKYNVTINAILNMLRDNGVELNAQSDYWTEDRRDHYRKLGLDGTIGIHGQSHHIHKKTDIELMFAQWCDDNDIECIEEYRIKPKGHRYDYYLPKLNLLVELDGLIWHTLPGRRKKDINYMYEAAKMCYNIIRFDDKLIYSTRGRCFDRIL